MTLQEMRFAKILAKRDIIDFHIDTLMTKLKDKGYLTEKNRLQTIKEIEKSLLWYRLEHSLENLK